MLFFFSNISPCAFRIQQKNLYSFCYERKRKERRSSKRYFFFLVWKSYFFVMIFHFFLSNIKKNNKLFFFVSYLLMLYFLFTKQSVSDWVQWLKKQEINLCRTKNLTSLPNQIHHKRNNEKTYININKIRKLKRKVKEKKTWHNKTYN